MMFYFVYPPKKEKNKIVGYNHEKENMTFTLHI